MQSDNDNHSAGSNGYNSLTNQTNTSSSSGVVPSNRHCTGNHVVFRSGCRSNSPGDGHTNSIVRYNAPPWGGWQTPEYPQHKTINHDLLSSTSSLLVLGKVEEQEKNPAMEPQHPSVGVACNGLGPAGCVYHSTEIYGGDTYASYNLDGNMPRGEKDRGPNSQTSTGDVVPAPVFNRGGGTGCNIFHLECHDTERLESIEYGWGGGRPALCRKWNGVTNTGGAGTEGVLPEQKVGLGDHGNESSSGRDMLGGPASQYQIDPLAETYGGCMLQSNLYFSIPYISITSLLALTLLTRIWDYGYNSILKTSINA